MRMKLASQSDVLHKPTLWIREKKQANAEVDFLIVKDGNVVPIEVKSGATGSLRSLHSYIDEGGLEVALRLYSGKKGMSPTKMAPVMEFFLLTSISFRSVTFPPFFWDLKDSTEAFI